MPITVVLADNTVYRKEPEMNSASDNVWERAAIAEEARTAQERAYSVLGQDVFTTADLSKLPALPPPPPRTIGIVGAELEKAIADVLRYRAAVEDEQRLRAELDALLGRATRKRRGG